ncbi:MAG: AraC family transcriptional regulator, partial [Paracoccaceae bacterium]
MLASPRFAHYEIRMTENALFAPATTPLTIALFVLPQASILEVASALDPLRNANRQLGHEAYRWRVVTPDGTPAPLTCGIELPSSGPLSHATGADALIVVAGYRLAQVATQPLIRDLRRIAPRFALVGGIDAAPWVLARAGLLNGYRATVHWEDLEDLATAHPEIDVVPDRFVIDRNRVTIAGAAPAADFMLHLIRVRHG